MDSPDDTVPDALRVPRQPSAQIRCLAVLSALPSHPGIDTDTSSASATPCPVTHAPASITTPGPCTTAAASPPAWHTFSYRRASVSCLATAPQSRIRRSRPGSAPSAGGRQGALPCLDAGRTLAARNPTCELPAKTGPERSAAVRPPPVAWGARHRAPTAKGGREPTRGPYASRCRGHPNRSGDPKGLRLTTARSDSVRRYRSTGSGDGRIGHR